MSFGLEFPQIARVHSWASSGGGTSGSRFGVEMHASFKILVHRSLVSATALIPSACFLLTGCTEPRTAERTSPQSTVTADSAVIAVFDPDPATWPDDERRYRKIRVELDSEAVLSEEIDFVLTRWIPDSYKRELSRSLELGPHTIRVMDGTDHLHATLTFDHVQEKTWILVGYRCDPQGRATAIHLEARNSPPTER